MNRAAIEEALGQDWFYRVELADGSVTNSYVDDHVSQIHDTRAQMLAASLDDFMPEAQRKRAVDIACHQGFFSLQLARAGFDEVTALDARAEHVERTRLLMRATGEERVRAEVGDVYELTAQDHGQFDLVLVFGLLYHLENPVLALRRARDLCAGTMIIETQIAPNMSGPLDYGSFRFVKPIEGAFAIVDETEETHGPETSTQGICLVPSYEALVFILERLGFQRIEKVAVPDGGYEQLRFGKRVMIAASL
jgi:SAM-dependent methyltransferase